MAVTMYDVSVPVFVRVLENLRDILKKGQAFAQANGLDEKELIEAKLAVDMFPLNRQVQIASDAAKGAGGRLGGIEVPSFEDKEVTFEELFERVDKTITFLKSVPAANVVGSEDKVVEFANKGGAYKFSGKDYLMTFAFPNFFFHVTTAYDILRHKGVELGKKDYLGAYAER